MAGYFLKRESKIHGPLDGGKLVTLARAGKVNPTDEISASQEGPWQRADSVSALKAVFDKRESGTAVNPPAKPAETDHNSASRPDEEAAHQAPAPSNITDHCTDCGGLVSVQVKTCPHCGAPVASKENLKNKPSLWMRYGNWKRASLQREFTMGVLGLVCLPFYFIPLYIYRAVRAWGRRPGLHRAFCLGDPAGRALAEITQFVGRPNTLGATFEGYMAQWSAEGMHLALLFDNNDICQGVFSRTNC